MSVFPWYKCNPEDFLFGTFNLKTTEDRWMYTVVINLMYSKGGPIADDMQWVGRVAAISTRAAAKARDALVEAGKIYRTEDGRLSNARVEAEIAAREKEHRVRQASGEKGGKISAEKRANEPDINELASCELEHSRSQISDTRSTHSPSESEGARAKEARGYRLPDDWAPSEEGLKFAAEWGVDAIATASAFRDYWHSVPGQRGRKLDWDGTWRNWCRKEGRRPATATLPLLRPIDGGKGSQQNVDLSDDWGLEAWCKSIGANPITDPVVLPRGKWEYHGAIIDFVARKVAAAARFNKAWRGDWSLLAQWIVAGIQPEQMIPIINRMADRFATNGNPAVTLKVFDRAVRDLAAAGQTPSFMEAAAHA